MRTVAYSCLVLLGAYTAAHGGWFSYDNYEDCMLGRMKGQSQMMYSTADKACKKQFNVEVDVPVDWVKWHFGWQISIESASDGTDEYEITSGEFVFSPKSCEASTAADFSKPIRLQLVAGEAKLPFAIGHGDFDAWMKAMSEGKNMQCGRALSFKGKYK